MDFAGAAIGAAPLLPGSFSQGVVHALAAGSGDALPEHLLTSSRWVATGCRVAAAQGDAFHTCWLATCDAMVLLGNGSDSAAARRALVRADSARDACARYMQRSDFAAVAEMRQMVDMALKALASRLESDRQTSQQGRGPGAGPADVEMRVACWSCCAATSTAKKCALCQEAVYCGKDCQKKHWAAGHRKSCAGKAKKEDGPVPGGGLGD